MQPKPPAQTPTQVVWTYFLKSVAPPPGPLVLKAVRLKRSAIIDRFPGVSTPAPAAPELIPPSRVSAAGNPLLQGQSSTLIGLSEMSCQRSYLSLRPELLNSSS